MTIFAVAQGSGGDEAETWSFLGLLFEDDARRELLKRMGFEDFMVKEQHPVANGVDAAAAGMEQMALGTDGKER